MGRSSFRGSVVRKLGLATTCRGASVILGHWFENENLAALRIDAGHDVPDDPVLGNSVHRLKNQE
jgi:hypothetical protein